MQMLHTCTERTTVGREGRSRVAEDVTPGLHARSSPHVDNVSAGRLLYLGTVSLVSDDHPGVLGCQAASCCRPRDVPARQCGQA